MLNSPPVDAATSHWAILSLLIWSPGLHLPRCLLPFSCVLGYTHTLTSRSSQKYYLWVKHFILSARFYSSAFLKVVAKPSVSSRDAATSCSWHRQINIGMFWKAAFSSPLQADHLRINDATRIAHYVKIKDDTSTIWTQSDWCILIFVHTFSGVSVTVTDSLWDNISRRAFFGKNRTYQY